MKIISKRKDYYDYLVGKYGIDEKITYDRKQKRFYNPHYKNSLLPYPTPKSNGLAYFYIAFCDVIYCVIQFNGDFYYADEFENLPEELKQVIINEKYNSILKRKHFLNTYKFRINLVNTDINIINNSPIILLSIHGEPVLTNFILKDYGFHKVMDAETCYLKLQNWFLQDKIVIDNRSDLLKLEAAGFDKKTSFRNIK